MANRKKRRWPLSVLVMMNNVIGYFTFFVTMFRSGLFLFFCSVVLLNTKAQTIPLTPALFFSNVKPTNQFPDKLLSGRTVLIYTTGITNKDLQQAQSQFAQTGIDAVLTMPIQRVIGGHDVITTAIALFNKREVQVLAFVQKYLTTYTVTLASYSGNTKLINQSAIWQLSGPSLYEILLQVNREALNTFKKQNLLISDSPELATENTIITGSRVEAFTADLRVDRMAVRLSGRKEEDNLLQEICRNYPFKIEFVGDSITDAHLRQKGFWYTLNSVAGYENLVRTTLGYPQTETNTTSASSNTVYKFYAKKLESEIFYLGRSWDADPYWPKALENFINNVRKELQAP
jgi:hypothetical protein